MPGAQAIEMENTLERLLEIQRSLIKRTLAYTVPADENEYFEQYARPLRILQKVLFCITMMSIAPAVIFLFSAARVENNTIESLDQNASIALAALFSALVVLPFATIFVLACSLKCMTKTLSYMPNKTIFLPDGFNLLELNNLLYSVDIEEIKAISTTKDLIEAASRIDKAIYRLEDKDGFNYQ